MCAAPASAGAESGAYDLGDDFIDDALTADEAESGLVLTCQMKPAARLRHRRADNSGRPARPDSRQFTATVARVVPHNDAAIVLELDIAGAAAPAFLPGQYVNIDVPGSGQSRSYSFTSAPGETTRRLPDQDDTRAG
ncbi:hypothetical protein [Rhizobium yanglingense]